MLKFKANSTSGIKFKCLMIAQINPRRFTLLAVDQNGTLNRVSEGKFVEFDASILNSPYFSIESKVDAVKSFCMEFGVEFTEKQTSKLAQKIDRLISF